MPEKFIVPQFIDNEDKILGPITVRQFLILLAAVVVLFILYKLLATLYFVLSGLLVVGLAGLFGFYKVNGQPFHIFFVNFLQTMSRPNMRIWDKELNDAELRALLKVDTPPPVELTPRKDRPGGSRLRDLSLVVNTGGVYKPEDDNLM